MSSSELVHDFDDLSPQDYHFSFKKNRYVLREPSEAAAVAYTKGRMVGVEMVHNQDDEVRTLRSMQAVADVEPLLVSMCLFTEGGDPVSLATVKQWPSRVVRPLFEKAKEMGQLDDDPKADMESLQKQVDKLQKRMEKLKNKGADVKNSLTAGAGTSD